MKVIGLMVDFLKIVKLWRLSTEFCGVEPSQALTSSSKTTKFQKDNLFVPAVAHLKTNYRSHYHWQARSHPSLFRLGLTTAVLPVRSREFFTSTAGPEPPKLEWSG